MNFIIMVIRLSCWQFTWNIIMQKIKINGVQNMEYMLDHETLFGTVARTLRYGFKKSTDLALYLFNIFQAYSNFT